MRVSPAVQLEPRGETRLIARQCEYAFTRACAHYLRRVEEPRGHGLHAATPEVRALADLLAPLSAEVLGARFDPAAMIAADIYPSIWDRDPAEDDTKGYVLKYYEALRRFVTDAAQAGEAVIVYLS